ncbi:uncharacterized protein LOC143308255 [Osmia lignaria lignaria]|uniref:uncharacterized protein LOC143308255 n=1 Tax=Osmia lignaria lignaria TaxID=1437193 RepID=UPI00402BD52C
MLTPDSNLDPEWLLDDTNISSLRRRKVLTDSDQCIASHSSDSNFNVSAGMSLISNPYRSTNLDDKYVKSKKLITYPKINANYPKILSNDKIDPKSISKRKKLDGRYTKPPSLKPPVFLKCKVKRKTENNREKVSDQTEENDLTLSTTTDLDIQFSKVKLESISKFDSSSKNETLTVSENETQTLRQYCSFEDKKMRRVAPHIRRKDVVCDTVDVWSHSNSSKYSTELRRYKPLIFGGTYPIDLPVSFKTDFYSTESTDVPFKNMFSKTYDIDVPINCE